MLPAVADMAAADGTLSAPGGPPEDAPTHTSDMHNAHFAAHSLKPLYLARETDHVA